MMPVGPATRIYLAAGATDLRKSFVNGSPIKAGVNKKKVICPRFLFGFFGRFERPLPS
jgi:hypothetical protein